MWWVEDEERPLSAVSSGVLSGAGNGRESFFSKNKLVMHASHLCESYHLSLHLLS
jgi:hypothetical protein